ncbi:MAG TPA: amidase [Acetobacteraceae bacterium]|nr:amidase [Acetobacteraceae bacterium]
MEPQSDDVGAYVPGPRAVLEPTGRGPLDGVTFAVKDLFDVAGVVTTCGNPDWARTHGPAAGTAPIVAALCAAGGRMVGKTRTVELAFGITGENPWHGTPVNPRMPRRFPGGSSCGSVAAVAARLVPMALGSDTGGSVRIPASYCGLYGIRPTQGAISLAATMPLAPSLDTPGWFTRDAELLERVGQVLLPGEAGRLAGPLLNVREVWANAEPSVAAALRPALERLAPLFGPALEVSLLPEGIPALYRAYRAVQAEEAWGSHGNWITEAKPALGEAVARRFEMARQTPAADSAAGRAVRQAMQARLRPLLAGGAVLIYPTSPSPAPEIAAPAAALETVREATVGTTAIAGLAGLPEVTLPAATVRVPDGDAPVGLSLVGGFGRDRALLALAREAAALLGLA